MPDLLSSGWHGLARRASALGLCVALIGAALPMQPAPVAVEPDSPTQSHIAERYAQLPLSFEANHGQVDPAVDFIARGSGYTLFLTRVEAVLALRAPSSPAGSRDAARGSAANGAVIRLAFLGAQPTAAVAAIDALPGKVNYFRGSDPERWKTNIPTYAKIAYRDFYPGIDVIYYGKQGQLEYDLVVAPQADPGVIALRFEGAEKLTLDPRGDLVLTVSGGDLRMTRPVIYQEVDGARETIAGSFALNAAGEVRFELGPYDTGRPLVIDPGLVYSTYLGGGGQDAGNGIALDALGNAYVTGLTFSTDFPTTPGTLDSSRDGFEDAFVTKLNAAGSALVYSTYLGGSSFDSANGIIVDAAGSAYVTGQTSSENFPTTTLAHDTSSNGSVDAFVTKLSATGSALVYSSYLGGSLQDLGNGIALDASGNAYITGVTLSTNFPTTLLAFDTSPNGGTDAFITKLNSAGSALVYSSYLGGSGQDHGNGIALDGASNAYVTGETSTATGEPSSANFPTTPLAFDTSQNGSLDAFVTKLNSAGSALVYSTYLGGSGFDRSNAIAVDAAGSTHVTGETFSTNFPTTPLAFDTSYNGIGDAFVTKLNSAGSAPLLYSTYLGGGAQDAGNGIVIDAAGNAYVTGSTDSANFPTTVGAFDTSYNGSVDAFVTKLSPTGSTPLLYSTYLGSGNFDGGLGIAVDASGNSYVTGQTSSGGFPTTTTAFDTSHNGGIDAFVTKLDMIPGPVPAMVTLSQAAATNTVGTSHTVTATVTDSAGNPVPDVTVRFSVTGSVSASGSCTTDAAGQCSFTYSGPTFPGADAITAFADTDGSGTQDLGEPVGTATKTWILPVSTPGRVAGGGTITGPAGPISFNVHAQNNDGTPKGGCSVSDPVGVTIICLDVDSLVVASGTATIFGDATQNGVATQYLIQATDNGAPGKGKDTFSITTKAGYSRSGTLTEGNIQVRPN